MQRTILTSLVEITATFSDRTNVGLAPVPSLSQVGAALRAHLPHYSDASKARVGAIVIFGPGTGEHGAVVMESGTDPWLFSHGYEGGPNRIRLSQERTYHHSPVTFLNVSGIGPLK